MSDEFPVQKQCFLYWPANDLGPYFSQTPNHVVENSVLGACFTYICNYIYIYIYMFGGKLIFFQKATIIPLLGLFLFAM